MGYDEKIFKAKANIKARRLWLVFAILLTANYGTDTANGAYSVSNYIIFVILCWLPFVCGDILLKRNETRKMTSSIEETLRLIQLTLEKVMQTCENVEKCTLIIYLAAHIYIVAVNAEYYDT